MRYLYMYSCIWHATNTLVSVACCKVPPSLK